MFSTKLVSFLSIDLTVGPGKQGGCNDFAAPKILQTLFPYLLLLMTSKYEENNQTCHNYLVHKFNFQAFRIQISPRVFRIIIKFLMSITFFNYDIKNLIVMQKACGFCSLKLDMWTVKCSVLSKIGHVCLIT